MVAGTLADAGYYMGDTMLAANEANPKGYFESREVEAVNDALITTMLNPTRAERMLRWIRPIQQQPAFAHAQEHMKVHWLALLPPARDPIPRTYMRRQIEALTAHEPYCFKDPRFCYTLPAWRPYLKNTAFVVVFRRPVITAASIVKEVQREDYLKGIDYTFDMAVDLWVYVYRHILQKHRRDGDWLFLHYDQVLTPQGLDRIEAHVGAKVNRNFPDAALTRTESDAPIPRRAAAVYKKLCQLAGYRDA